MSSDNERDGATTMFERVPTWLFNSVKAAVAVAVFYVSFFVWPLDADGQCPADDQGCVTFAKNKVERFKDGRLGNSAGFVFPKVFRDKADNAYRRWYDAHQAFAKGIDITPDPLDQWWHDTTTRVRCEVSTAVNGGDCYHPTPGSAELQKMRQMAVYTTHVTVGCGATALVAAIEKSGVPDGFTFGRGFTVCMFGIAYWQQIHKSEPIPDAVIGAEEQ